MSLQFLKLFDLLGSVRSAIFVRFSTQWCQILGHSDISMTMNIYSHVLPTIQEDVVDRLNQAFKEWENEDELEDGEDNDVI